MGSTANPITRQEFITPPEFRGLDSTADPAARVGGARIELIRCGDETRLGACYQQIPVRLLPPFSFDGEPAALLFLINLTAGLMDGDAHLIEITARAGSRTVVTGQSASRVHPALAGYATQQWDVDVEPDACLVVLPGPAIPFCRSRYYQRSRVRLAPNARLIWGDVWLPGRYERGALSEKYQFERIVQDFEVHRAETLIYRERFRWDGPWTAEDVQWHWGGALATGSLLIAGPVPETLPAPSPSVRRAIFRLDADTCCIRWCGEPAEITYDLVQTALQLAAYSTEQPDAPPWLLTSSALAPNHWFSIPEGHRRPRSV